MHYNRIWGSTGDVTEPDINKAEEGWGTVEFPRHDWQNWFMNLVSRGLQQLQRTGAIEWDAAVPYVAGMVVRYSGAYYYANSNTTGQQPDVTPSVWKVIPRINSEFQSGVLLAFPQETVPDGWTKVTTHNNAAMRIVNTSGGGTGGAMNFTDAFSGYREPNWAGAHGHSVTVYNHTLTEAQMPTHRHIYRADPYAIGTDDGASYVGQYGNLDTWSSYAGGSQPHAHGAGASNVGDHTHPFAMDVKYVDFLIGQKA